MLSGAFLPTNSFAAVESKYFVILLANEINEWLAAKPFFVSAKVQLEHVRY